MYKDLKTVQEARVKVLVDIYALHEVLGKAHKEVNNTDKMERTRAQKQHNTKTNVQSVDIAIENYVTFKTHAMREQKL